MKLTALEDTDPVHALIFGPPKSGKTQLAGTLAQEYNLIWFDLERGIGTLRKLPTEQQARIEVISLPDTRSFPIAIQTMLKVIKGGEHNICDTHGTVRCAVCAKNPAATHTTINLSTIGRDTVVVIDSLTQLTNSAIAHITKHQPDDYKLDYDDWGNLGKLMDMFLSHVQQAPYHVACISHETEVEMVDGKPKIVPTAGTRNFSRNSAKYFGEVIYCEVKNKKHVTSSSTTASNSILTGSRTGKALEDKDTLLDMFRAPKPSVTAAVTDKLVALRDSMRK